MNMSIVRTDTFYCSKTTNSNLCVLCCSCYVSQFGGFTALLKAHLHICALYKLQVSVSQYSSRCGESEMVL